MVAKSNEDPESFSEFMKGVAEEGAGLAYDLFEVYKSIMISLDDEERKEFFDLPSYPLNNYKMAVMVGYIRVLERTVLDQNEKLKSK